ncbi:MAG: hypothetical protein R3236_08785, partial [Phycisphaeraceae bacterium]|nr:hypothetical protein [Phycisphaeraceae bacterium]
NDMPDMAQTLAVAALFAEGPTWIRNVGNLRLKETDRIHAMEQELSRLGAQVQVRGDDLRIETNRPGEFLPAEIRTYDDHRMAMAFSLAARVDRRVRILDPACVNKTFPDYWQALKSLKK